MRGLSMPDTGSYVLFFMNIMSFMCFLVTNNNANLYVYLGTGMANFPAISVHLLICTLVFVVFVQDKHV